MDISADFLPKGFDVRIGIVAEGPGDIAVLRNILKAKLGLDAADVEPLRPKLARDETDLAAEQTKRGYQAPTAESYSNWTIVLEECGRRTTIADFLDNQLDEERLVVIHIDTAEAHLPGYDIQRPERKTTDYSDKLRTLVADKMTALLGPELATKVRFAIAIEETEAWLLTIHDKQNTKDTSHYVDPKKRLHYLLDQTTSPAKPDKNAGKQGRSSSSLSKTAKKPSEYELAHSQSLSFRDRKTLIACTSRNRSLQLFLDSL